MLWGQAGGLGISLVNDWDTLVSKKKNKKKTKKNGPKERVLNSQHEILQF
jgi:hypothetical protein